MKFKIEKNDLIENIRELGRIVPVRNAMPILSNFLIHASEETNTVKITASDMQRTVIVDFKANIVEGGKVAVSAKDFSNIVNSFQDDLISMETIDNFLEIKCKNSDFKLLCAETEQYPIVPDINFDDSLTLNALHLKKIINQTVFAVSKETKRKAFSGVFWEIVSDNQLMTATDGKTVAEIQHKENFEGVEEISKIMPLIACEFLAKIISSEDNIINVMFRENRVMFKYQNYVIISNYIDATYPDYKSVIPTSQNKRELVIKRSELMDTIRRVSLLANEETQKIKFDINQSTLEISTVNRDSGEARDSVKVVDYNDEPMAISFNYRYCLEILKRLETEDIKIKLNKAKNPVIFYNIKEKEDDFQETFVLMPLRTS